ncbi:translation initiation factor IF-2 [Candidatus Woesearchaeota archaeon]|nr:translation initiation factor IF-2 [Candidatus Woesearchaeota archaeon]
MAKNDVKSSIRSPVCSVIGHVDHGKSSILDSIRGTRIISKEAGGITQAIGASIIPLEVIEKKAGALLRALNMEFTIPGLLFIDTPGHAAFTSLRKRGGNLADIAILVVDINEGFKPQTIECIEILKNYKTPFVVAANKLDLAPGWKEKKGSVLQGIATQEAKTTTTVETRIYEVVGKLHEFGFPSERFDRVSDFTKEIAIVPVSAKTGEGIPELLMVVTGLAQRYLEKCLKCNVAGPAKGTILEVKEEKGLGKTLDVIIYDGTLHVNDTIIIGGVDGPIVSKIRALLQPIPLAEMRDKKAKFSTVKMAIAATGVKISAPDIGNVIAGMPLRGGKQIDIEQAKNDVQSEVNEVIIETEKEGIIVKADTIGSLEAIVGLLRSKGASIRKATVGELSKKDIADAESNIEKQPLNTVILSFNTTVSEEIFHFAKEKKVKIISNDIIYALIDEFDAWLEAEKKRIEVKELEGLVRPCKIKLMPNYTFRQSNPAIVGADILIGNLKVGMPLMKDGNNISTVKSIQHEKDTMSSIGAGKQVAVALPNVTVGRQINENDVLYSGIPEPDFRKLKSLKSYLKKEEIEVMKDIAELKRRKHPLWGI